MLKLSKNAILIFSILKRYNECRLLYIKRKSSFYLFNLWAQLTQYELQLNTFSSRFGVKEIKTIASTTTSSNYGNNYYHYKRYNNNYISAYYYSLILAYRIINM